MKTEELESLRYSIERLETDGFEKAINRLIDARLDQLFKAARAVGSSADGIGGILEESLSIIRDK